MKLKKVIGGLKCQPSYQMHRRIGMIKIEGIREIE